jgi:hypothetical protein
LDLATWLFGFDSWLHPSILSTRAGSLWIAVRPDIGY